MVLTPGGKRRLARRLATTRAEFEAVCADMPAALESGDPSGWHDNFAFEENQRRMHMLARRVRELERLLDAAEVVPMFNGSPERAFVGTRVRWRYERDSEDVLRETWIAGYEDGDPSLGRVSYDSPLGQALLGAEEGDSRELRLGETRQRIEILSIEAASPESDLEDVS
jgi:transcription elongation factor GreA